MRKGAPVAFAVAVLAAAALHAAVLFDSGGFGSPYDSGPGGAGAELAGQVGWSGGVAPDGAMIGGGVYYTGDQMVVLSSYETDTNSYGVWTHSLDPTSWPIVSTTWIQAGVAGNSAVSGVGLYDGDTMIASVGLVGDDSWHNLQMDANFATHQVNIYLDGSLSGSFPFIGTKADSVALFITGGSGFGYFDDLAVNSVPEPTVLAVLAGSSVLMLRRRRVA